MAPLMVVLVGRSAVVGRAVAEESQAQLAVEVAVAQALVEMGVVEMAVGGSECHKVPRTACHKRSSSPIFEVEEAPNPHLGSKLKLPRRSKSSTAVVSGVDAPFLHCRYRI